MNFLYIGKIVNTHGIKGELRIISDIDNKSLIFKVGNYLYIGDSHDKEQISSYRVHKNFDMVTFMNLNDINDALKYKSKDVYINLIDYNVTFINQLIGYKIKCLNDYYGEVIEISKNKVGYLLKIKYNNTYYIPYTDHFVLKVDNDNKVIYINDIKELLL